MTPVQHALVQADLADASGRITFKSSLSKTRRIALEALKLEHGISALSASIAVYLLWNGLKTLPVCACGSGLPVVWPQLKSCSVKCARSMVLKTQATGWNPTVEEQQLTAAKLLDRYELFGKRHGLTATQHAVLGYLAKQHGITNRYKPRQLITLLRSGQKSFPLCTCGSGREVIPEHKNTKFCSPQCSAARTAAVENAKLTNLNRYGVKNVYQRPEVVQQIKNTLQTRYAADIWPARLEQIEREDKVQLQGDRAWVCHDHPYQWRCEAGHLFTAYIADGRRPWCSICHPRSSKPQLQVHEFLQTLGCRALANDRTIIKPYELDIVLPDHRIAVELNGVWHHHDVNKPTGYHRMKHDRCEAVGWRLVQITDAEWYGKQLLVQDRLRAILGKIDRKIAARLCKVQSLSMKTAKVFCESNHLQGWVPSKHCLGLMYDDELVGVATFGRPRFSSDAEHELLRLCFKLGTSVQGGASKLLKAFRVGHAGSILSFCDLRYSTGRVYQQLGFEQLRQTAPGYFYVNMNGHMLSRYQAQKHRLEKILVKFNSQLSERDNLYANGYWRIEDAGHKVFLLK